MARILGQPLVDNRLEGGVRCFDLGRRRLGTRAPLIGFELRQQRVVMRGDTARIVLRIGLAAVAADRFLRRRRQPIEAVLVHQDQQRRAAEPQQIVVARDAIDAEIVKRADMKRRTVDLAAFDRRDDAVAGHDPSIGAELLQHDLVGAVGGAQLHVVQIGEAGELLRRVQA